MKRRTQAFSPKGKITVNKLDPGVFVVEIPETGRKISLGQPPDAIKRLQQVGYYGSNAVNTFVLADSKLQGDSISWVLVEFPILYALYLSTVEVKGNFIPAFFAGKFPMLAGLEEDVDKALKMIKYSNYGVDRLEELDEMDIPTKTRDALRKEILGLAVGNEIKDSKSFIDSVYLAANPKSEKEFTDIGDKILIGRLGYNKYRFVYKKDGIDVDVNLLPAENFRAPIEYKHLKFPVKNFGIWHTGEYDGMDPYFSCAHTTIIHKYEPIMIDYPSNMTDIINQNGLSKQSINTVIVTHNHDDHVGAMVELFRRNQPCHIITTEPVKHSLIKKLSTLVDLPEKAVSSSFNWTVLPFRSDEPYRTETLNLDGLMITGHLSCHSVPTTVYTFDIIQDGYCYSYGHFLDIVAFKRMEMLVKDSWMPKDHLDYLDRLVRKTKYSLLKYDAGCATDAAIPFTVHGQWQDLKNAATERSFRLFTHVNRDMLDPDYDREGRFVRIGDLDTALRTQDGKMIRLGTGTNANIAFFYQAYQLVLKYFESLMDGPVDANLLKKMAHYAFAFANSQKQPDPNIGSFLIEQDGRADFVYIIIRGMAEIQKSDDNGHLIFRSTIGDGEVLGDHGVISRRPRSASIKSMNHLTYLAVPANLFLEAMTALSINYEGNYKEMLERRELFQATEDLGQDVSTIILNGIAQKSEARKVKKGDVLIKKGAKDNKLLIVPGKVKLQVGKTRKQLMGPTLIGECEFFLHNGKKPSARLHSATAEESMEILSMDPCVVRDVPVIVDNIRRLIRSRCSSIYQNLPQIDKSL
ncbi:MAG: cyclic nucleotide-binding domain-containing protein [Proteobacteria bacterium]|nr:cyclic nucleotide-binding domain-containing protein [Pseudomonadota bacterium]